MKLFKTLCLLLLMAVVSAVLQPVLAPAVAHAQAMVSGGGSDSCTGQACEVTSLSASGAIQSTAAANNNAFVAGADAKWCGNGPSCGSYFKNNGGVAWQFTNTIQMTSAGGGVYGDVFQGYTPNTSTQLIGKANDGASAKAIRFRTSGAFSTQGALINTWENDATVRASIDMHGSLRVTEGSPTKPTCAAGLRGRLWYTESGAGVADLMQVCLKNSGDTYAWTTL